MHDDERTDPADDIIDALAAGAGAGLVMDFDGVLSPITEDPERSALLPGTAEILARLAERLTVVALLSGRPLEFLQREASVPGVALHGSYGLEHLGAQGPVVSPEAERWKPAVEVASRVLHRELGHLDGVFIEDKTLAVAVHWRRAADRAAAEQQVAPVVQELVERCGLRREPGKFVEELRMPLEQDKGTALQAIIDGAALRTVAYAGDDRGDLPAFEVALAAGGSALVVDAPDMADDVARVAGVHLDGPEAFQRWLRRLERALA